MFHGSSLDVYIHWLIFSLGLAVLLSAIAVLASCRSFAGLLKINITGNSRGMKFYRGLYKYHSVWWMAFWWILIMHLMVTMIHVGPPLANEPFHISHLIVFFTAIGNILLVTAVLSSCRTFSGMFGRLVSKKPRINKIYRSFYRYHSYAWWLLGAFIGVHIVSGLIHAMNT